MKVTLNEVAQTSNRADKCSPGLYVITEAVFNCTGKVVLITGSVKNDNFKMILLEDLTTTWSNYCSIEVRKLSKGSTITIVVE